MTEDSFLKALRERPDDGATRLVFADWLEEQGDEVSRAKAAYLRLDGEMAASPRKAKHRGKNKQRRELAARLPTGWLAVVSRARIELCEFRYECPQRWETLEPVEGSTTDRYCRQCQQTVKYCEDIEAALQHAGTGGCVAIDARVVRTRGDLYPQHLEMTLGILAVDYTTGDELREEAARQRDEIERLPDL